MGKPLPDVRRIGVFRPNAIGDFMFTLPALHALRETYPEAEIVLLGKAWHAQYLHGRTALVDRVEIVPPFPGIEASVDAPRDTAEQRAFLTAMRHEAFDIVLQLYGGGRHSNPLVANFGARLTAGLRSLEAAPLDRWLPYQMLFNERLRLLNAAGLVGARASTLRPPFAPTEQDRAELRAQCAVRSPYAVLQPCVGDARRRWPAAHFAAVADALAAMGLGVVVHGTASERHLVDAVLDAARSPGLVTAIDIGLGALTALLHGAQLMVSNDTGPLHLALALGTPSVGIFIIINLINASPLVLRGFRSAVSARVHCPECGQENLDTRCPHNPSFVADVTPETVIALARDLMQETLSAREAGAPVR